MDGVDYTKQLNRQNEVYQKTLRDLKRSHTERVEGINKQKESQLESQSKAHSKGKLRIEKEAATTIDSYRREQQESLKEKSTAYQNETEKLMNKHHDTQKTNLKEWRDKFSNLKDRFDENSQTKDLANKEGRASLAENYKKNIESIRSKSREDLDNYLNTASKATDNTSEAYMKDKREMQESHAKEKTDIVKKNLREKRSILERGQRDISNMREAQTKEFLDGRDMAKEKFSKFSHKQNQKMENFEAERISKLDQAHQNQNMERNQEFSDRLEKINKQHHDSLRKVDNKRKVEEIANHAANRQIAADQKANEREQIRKQKQRIMDDKNKTVGSYEDKITETTKKYQDTIQDIRLENAKERVQKDKDITEHFRQREIKDRKQDRVRDYQHEIALNYSEDKSAARLDSQSKDNKDKVQNLKENFSKNMELAQLKARKDFEMNRKETVREKAELQKRLHEQNSKTNTYLKKVLNDKMQKMATGYERRIFELENQNKLIAANAQDAIRNISEQTRDEINRQREVSLNSAKVEIDSERANSLSKERELRKTLIKTQADFERKMNELTIENSRRLKEVTRRLESEKIAETRKYEDLNIQNQRFFEREVARIKASSESEKEALVTQYEDRIKSLMRVQRQKLKEMEEFDKLDNRA